MFSEISVNYYSNFFSYCELFCLFPYHWNPSTFRLTVHRSKIRLFIYITSLTWYTFECIHTSIELYHIIRDPLSEFNYKMKVILHCLSRIASLLLHYSVFFNRERHADFFNQVISMNRRFQGITN